MEIKCKPKSIKMGCFKPNCTCSCFLALINEMIDDINREIRERKNLAQDSNSSLAAAVVCMQDMDILFDFYRYLVDVKEQF